MAEDNCNSPSLEFSEKYDEEHAQAYFKKHNTGLERKLTNFRDHQIGRKALVLAGNPKSVLDMPCGTGRFWDLLAEEPERTIYASDYSNDMINMGLKFRAPEIVRRIETFQASAFNIPVEDNFVETIFCIRLIHHVGKKEERLKLLHELHRVCSNSVIISLWVDGNLKAWRRKKLEAKRGKRSYQNRFIASVSDIEAEFKETGFSIKGKLDFIPFYSMWRTYVLEKR
jgi:ubiquinone/menaquinone biosynthesis C-methylase UbiE